MFIDLCCGCVGMGENFKSTFVAYSTLLVMGMLQGCYTTDRVRQENTRLQRGREESLSDVVSRTDVERRFEFVEVDFSLPFRFLDGGDKEGLVGEGDVHDGYMRRQQDSGVVCYDAVQMIQKGDATCNGVIDIEDFAYVTSYVLSMENEKQECFFGCVQGVYAADVDCSGAITEDDQYLLMLYWVSEGEGISVGKKGCWKEKEEF